MTKKCSQCKTEKPTNDFYLKDKKYLRHICKICHDYQTTNRNRQYKIEAVRYKGGCCILCGYSKSTSEFHHRDPDQKDFTFGKTHRSLKSILIELNKCDMLCSNCHREAHFTTINQNPLSYQHRNRLEIKKEIVDYKGGKCEHCGYSKCLNALELHHKDPTTKLFGIGESRRRLSKIKSEVDKCELICANCHKEKHHN